MAESATRSSEVVMSLHWESHVENQHVQAEYNEKARTGSSETIRSYRQLKLYDTTCPIKATDGTLPSYKAQAPNTTRHTECSEVARIPSVKTAPEVQQISVTEFNKVVFDLETSSRGDEAEICQIAATDGRDEFNVYIAPRQGITSGATAVNKLRMKKGMLLHDNRRVAAVRQGTALTQLLGWLRFRTPCLLIAHNVKAFDAKHLMKAIASCNETKEFSGIVLGFSDTLTAFRERFPQRKSYTQISLAKDLLGITYNAHNALDDVRALRKLVAKFISSELLIKHSFTLSWHNKYMRFLCEKKRNQESLVPLVRSRKMSQGMAEKMAASGLSFDHVALVFETGGEQGVCDLLSERNEGKARVTNNEKVLTQLCDYFKELSLKNTSGLQ